MSTPAVRSTVHACGSWCSVSRRRAGAWRASFIPWSLPLAVRRGRRRGERGAGGGWGGGGGVGLFVHDIPLRAESGPSGPWARRLDAVVVVDCLAETQIERVIRRSGLAREQVQ